MWKERRLPEVGYEHTSLNFCAGLNRAGMFFRTKPHFNVEEWPGLKSNFFGILEQNYPQHQDLQVASWLTCLHFLRVFPSRLDTY